MRVKLNYIKRRFWFWYFARAPPSYNFTFKSLNLIPKRWSVCSWELSCTQSHFRPSNYFPCFDFFSTSFFSKFLFCFLQGVDSMLTDTSFTITLPRNIINIKNLVHKSASRWLATNVWAFVFSLIGELADIKKNLFIHYYLPFLLSCLSRPVSVSSCLILSWLVSFCLVLFCLVSPCFVLFCFV